MSLDKPADPVERAVANRRRFLVTTTAAVGSVGLAAAVWPLVAQMGPDAATRRTGDVVEVDLATIAPGTQRIVRWHDRPIFVVARTAAMLAAVEEEGFVPKLADPRSERRQQPGYARNRHRSLDPAFAVLVGVCTHCACVPTYFADAPVLVAPGGYICPCCAAHYDAAGRAYVGITDLNLPVPPYEILGRSRLRIGRNASDELFGLESVERI